MQPATAFSPHTKAPGRLSSKKVSKLTLYRLDSKDYFIKNWTIVVYSYVLLYCNGSIFNETVFKTLAA